MNGLIAELLVDFKMSLTNKYIARATNMSQSTPHMHVLVCMCNNFGTANGSISVHTNAFPCL